MFIVIVINLISLNIFLRIDLSKGRVYSLSPSSRQTVRQLEDRLVVKAYFTEKLPPQFASIRRYTRDLLEEYKTASGGKIRYEFINPTDENQLKEEARRHGVPPVNVQVRENDRLEVREAFLGLVFHYNDRIETIPLVQETRGLEYEITKAINKIASIGMQRVAFYGLTPDIPNDPRMMFWMQQQDKFQQAKETIRQNYDLVAVTLEDAIPNDVSTLVFSGAVDSLSTLQLYHIDQFIMGGNNVIFFQNRAMTDLQTQTANPINSNIFDLLDHYGAHIRDNLVLDAKSGSVNVQEQRGIFMHSTPVQYPFFPISNDINSHHPIVSQLANIMYLYVSELDTLSVSPDVNMIPLIYSSNQSSTVPGPYFNINIQQFLDRNFMNRLIQPRKVLTALYEGRYRSFFPSDPGFAMGFIPETAHAKIIVVPDMDFISSTGAGRNPSNMNFLMNALDYLSNNQALISLRSREVINKPLDIEKIVNIGTLDHTAAEKKRQSTRNMVKWVNILLPAMLLVVFGLIKYRIEISRRKRIKEIYE
jgi:gliding-associated putative ABC transporter substrate-binding component GldG